MADNIDTKSIKEKVNIINKYIESQGDKDPFKIEMEIIEKYPEIYDDYPHLVKKLCKKEDMTMLVTMLNRLQNVEDGKESLASVEYNLGNNLADKYLNPVVNKLNDTK